MLRGGEMVCVDMPKTYIEGRVFAFFMLPRDLAHSRRIAKLVINNAEIYAGFLQRTSIRSCPFA